MFLTFRTYNEHAFHKIKNTRGKKVGWSRYRPGVAERVGRGIALLFHDCSTRRGWVVSSTPRPHFTPGKDPVPILQEAGWAPGPVWTGGKSRPNRDSIPGRPARSQSLYRQSYPAHKNTRGKVPSIPSLYLTCLLYGRCIRLLRIKQEPNPLELWNKLQFEEEKTESIHHV